MPIWPFKNCRLALQILKISGIGFGLVIHWGDFLSCLHWTAFFSGISAVVTEGLRRIPPLPLNPVPLILRATSFSFFRLPH